MTPTESPSCFTPFKKDVRHIALPELFTFPFYYEPHALSLIAAQELQERLDAHAFKHNFGLEGDPEGLIIGKMFGVLVVQKENGELGYLAAFSGKLGNSNHHPGFVPPVFDILEEGSYIMEEMQRLNDLNLQVEAKEADPTYLKLKKEVASVRDEAARDIEVFRERMREMKRQRKVRREALPPDASDEERANLDKELILESLSMKHQLKVHVAEWEMKIESLEALLRTEEAILEVLKEQRSSTSSLLQQQIFKAYHFLNAEGEQKDLGLIFKDYSESEPPAGSGECAAPKLLQYAYTHNLTPLALAEFWWGTSPKSEIRTHGHFYPSCRGKCRPILGHMLKGLAVEPDPMLARPDLIPALDIVFEDEVLVIVNKPAEMLSVPGLNEMPSVYDQIRAKYPNATGPLTVHRLDMSTSGILVFTKTKEAHKIMQAQFIKRKVKKRYVALLDGTLPSDQGMIDLPLRLDLDDRPRQLVCYDYGKPAITRWKVIEQAYGKARVYFYPETGRTHQLRVHAAHHKGLNTPIVGDDLYGTRRERLHLHAEQLIFHHPETHEKITLTVPAPF